MTNLHMRYKNHSTPESNVKELLKEQTTAGAQSATPEGAEPFPVLAAKALANISNSAYAIQKAEVTLTDAQIKALPTTAVEIVAPETGFFHMPIMGFIKLRMIPANAYVVDTNASLQLIDAGVNYLSCPARMNVLLTTGATTQDTVMTLACPAIDSSASGSFANVMYTRQRTDLPYNAPYGGISIKDDWEGVANYTGGNAANVMTVTVYFLKLPI